jgi:para-aminobenzoate synthetase/4-amino-4-deoxychorismate lyase
MSLRASAIVFDPEHKRWLTFDRPTKVLFTHELNEVRSIIEEVERLSKEEGLWGVGCISYEAAPAFDPSLPVRADSKLPKVWFATFEEPAARPTIQQTCEATKLSWRPSVTEHEYKDVISKLKKYIRAGDTYQVNYSLRLHANGEVSSAALFSSMIQAQAGAYSSLIETDDFTVASASPELLFFKSGSALVCKPMKGTARRGRNSLEDRELSARLQACQKNRAENIMIVDMTRNDLSKIAERGSVSVTDLCSVERYPHVLQMTSTVEAKTRASTYEILQGLFPAASITGAPKRETMRIIAELESTPRNIYTGSIGVISPQNRSWFNVAIRTALIDHSNKTVEYGIGSGIVWDSVPKNEYQECLAKAAAVTISTPPHQLFETILWEPNSGLFLANHHLDRIESSALYFGWRFPRQDAEDLLSQVANKIRSESTPYRVKLFLSSDGTMRCEETPLTSLSSEYRVSLAKDPIDSSDITLYHKTTNRRVYDRAEPRVFGSDDTILWNERGEVTETKIANICVSIGGILYTPPVECGLLPGCYRQRLLRQGRVQERVITVDELLHSERIVLCNSLRREWEAKLVVATAL